MSKRHEREQKVLERLHNENRELKQEVRNLKAGIRRLNKGYDKFQETDIPEEKIKAVESAIKKICFDCNQGEYKLIIVAGRRFRCCDNCGKRGKVSYL